MAALVLVLSPAAGAQQPYQSAQEAADALAKAARTGEPKAVLQVLGRNGADIVSTGDRVADDMLRRQFVGAYDAKHQVTIAGDKATLIVGQDDFPFPIPLVRKRAGWQFDAAAGREEILARRIGRNELSAIQTCRAYVDAQHEYADRGVAGKGVYAQRIVSRPGKKDGLYWPSQPGEEESPLGKFVARAAAEGYVARGAGMPYHGYRYYVLTGQGRRAPGGRIDYRVGSKMIGGFALVAYPADYGNSGVMTFLVDHRGIVYQKDLGPRTAAVAFAMSAFAPDRTWKPVGEEAQAPAAR